MKKYKFFLPLFLVLALCVSFCLPAAAGFAETGVDTGAEAAANEPEIAAKAAVLIDLATGETLYDKNGDDQNYPASTTKIMTCYLALKYGSLDDTVTMPDDLYADIPEGASTAYLQVGEEMPLYDLLCCLMLPSANEAANAVAVYVSGSIEDFVALMNQEAEDLGCTGTHFVNPNGLGEMDHYTTANDLARITQAALTFDTFREICARSSYEVPATNLNEARTLLTTNYLLPGSEFSAYDYEYATGVKTGHTTQAGYCLVSTAENDGAALLSVVLGADSTVDSAGNETIGSFTASKKLLSWGFSSMASLGPADASTAETPVESQVETVEDTAQVSETPTPTPAPSVTVSATTSAVAYGNPDEAEASETQADSTSHTPTVVLVVILSIVALVLILLVLLMVRNSRRSNRQKRRK